MSCHCHDSETKSTAAPMGCGCGCSAENSKEHEHEHAHGGEESGLKTYLPVGLTTAMLALGLLCDHALNLAFFDGWLRLAWYLAAYLPVGIPVLKEAIETFREKDFFTEFTLMLIATIGAFVIGEYPEGVAVMLFYTVGELFQENAVKKARGNIKALLDIAPSQALVLRGGEFVAVKPEEVAVGETIRVKVGEKVPLDGVLLSERSAFNTAALTGESKPQTIRRDEAVKAGMVNETSVVDVLVEKRFEDSSLKRILNLVEHATERKAKPELLIRKFAKIYTPIVFLLAIGIAALPALFVADYVFFDWLYRALVFLVISCPCALVISIPLGYFGGIGAASSNGILFKGANFLDLITKVDTVVLDKTGTLTKGVFQVKNVVSMTSDADFVGATAAIEAQSNHPIAKAIVAYAKEAALPKVDSVEEVAGHGLKAQIGGATWLVGNGKLMRANGIAYDAAIDAIVDTTVLVARDKVFAGYIVIADEVKEDAAEAMSALRKAGVSQLVMLSGDKKAIVEQTAAEIGMDKAYGDLLPEQKLQHIEALKEKEGSVVAFVGDGINDTPALALSDISIAMGAMGSDAAIEVADVVIQTDQPSKIAVAMKIGKKTKQIVTMNVTMALVVKLGVMVLGAMGIASMWSAVFADVGVALLAILNAVRILKMKF